MEKLWLPLRHADLIPRHVKREELSQRCCLHLDMPLRIVLVVERDDVESQAVAACRRNPFNSLGKIITSVLPEPRLFDLDHPLLAHLAELAVVGIPKREVDFPNRRQ